MIKKVLPKSEFTRNVLTLMTGTTIAQAVPIAIAPILTRIYTPKEFGVFALYMAIASIASSVATGRYELAIMLPEKENDAANILVLSMIIAVLISVIILMSVLIFNKQFTALLGQPQISKWLYFIPLSVLLTGFYQSLNYWNNRKRNYKYLATCRVVQSTVVTTTQLGAGFCGVGSGGLIVGALTGQSIGTVLLGRKAWKENSDLLRFINKPKLMGLARRYCQFPKYDIPATTINIVAQQLPNILLSSMFGPAYAGYYYLTQRVLQAPITLISGSVLDVFKESAAKDYREKGHAREIYKATFIRLLFLSLLPCVVLYFFIEDIFRFAFGNEWVIAGEYARILLPALFLRFLANPLSFMFYVAEKQHMNLIGMSVLLAMILLSFILSNTHYQVILNMSITFVIVYIFYIIFSAKFARLFS